MTVQELRELLDGLPQSAASASVILIPNSDNDGEAEIIDVVYQYGVVRIKFNWLTEPDQGE